MISFRLKTILGIALIEIALLAIIVASGLKQLQDSQEKQIFNHTEATLKLFVAANTDAILSSDLAKLESAVEEMSHHPEVVYINIQSYGETLSARGLPQYINQPRSLDNSLSEIDDDILDTLHNIQVDGEIIATVKLGISVQSFKETFFQMLNWTISIAVIEMILVVFFSLLLGNYLIRQISVVTNAAEIITKKGPGYIVETSGNDELAELSKAFNKMSTSLKSSHDDLEESLFIQNKLLIDANAKEAKIQAMLEASLDALVIINQDQRILDFNSVAEQTFGWKKHEVMNKPMTEFIIPERLREAHHNGMQHYLATGEGPVIGKRLELPALHKDGHEFPIEITISVIHLDQGNIFTAYIRDITDRRRIETELNLAAITFESIEAKFIANNNQQVIRTNKAFEKITGFTEEEVIGQNPKEFLKSGFHPKEFYDAMWNQIRETGQWSGEIYNKRKNGEIFPEFLNISEVYDDSGTRTHFVASFIDISKQKRNEERLKLARLEADSANLAKSRFLATMSHEIRTPIGAVLGILEMLKQTDISQKQGNLIRTAEQNGKQLLEIINTILDFSKMKAGKLKLNEQPFPLIEIFNTVRDMLSSQAENKSLYIKLKIDAQIPEYVQGDATRIRQILINLLNNAIKFTEQGGITVTANTEKINEKDFYLVCRVTDTGVGIPEAFKATLFDEFTMSDETHSRKQEGSGLGLTISKQLAELMQGRITLVDDDQPGASFEFKIKIQYSSQEEYIKSSIAFTSKTHISKKDLRILVAEDNAANRLIFGNYLKSEDIAHDFAVNGKEAVELFNQNDYDLVLMDISMPIVDGIEATNQIRRSASANNHLPIIALTAHTMDDEIKHFLSEGMNDHLSKPCNKESMMQCLNKWSDTEVLENLKSHDTSTDKSDDEYVEDSVRNLHAETESTGEKNTQTKIEPNHELMDNNVIEQLIRDTSIDIVPELLEFYVAESEKLMLLISEAYDNKDAEKLEFHAHTLGSSSGSHAAMPLHYLARKIEHLCRENKAEEGFDLVDELKKLAIQSFEAISDKAQQLRQQL